MRRKLFTFTVGIILSLGLADILGVMPDTDRYSLIFSAGEEFEGTICSVEKKDEGYRLTIDVYDEGKRPEGRSCHITAISRIHIHWSGAGAYSVVNCLNRRAGGTRLL